MINLIIMWSGDIMMFYLLQKASFLTVFLFDKAIKLTCFIFLISMFFLMVLVLETGSIVTLCLLPFAVTWSVASLTSWPFCNLSLYCIACVLKRNQMRNRYTQTGSYLKGFQLNFCPITLFNKVSKFIVLMPCLSKISFNIRVPNRISFPLKTLRDI